MPPPPNRLDECLDALKSFLHSEDAALPPLIRADLAHVQFETQEVRQAGTWETWMEFVLTGVAETAEHASATTRAASATR